MVSFEAKFKKAGTKPVQVWEGKYASLLKSNGWGGNGGRKWPKNWHERDLATAELDSILGRQVLVQLPAKKAPEAGPAGESSWGADAGSRQLLLRPSKQPLMVRTFLKVYMELGSYFLCLQEQIKDIIIMRPGKQH